MDYPAWIQRAERFVRRLNHLPGEWHISVAVGQPASAGEIEVIEESLDRPIPTPLRTLYLKGAASLDCQYSWSPGPEYCTRIESLWSHEEDFFGGARWISLQELPDYCGGLGGWDGCQIIDEAGETTEAKHICRNAFPVIAVESGDYIALDMTKDLEDSPVVYLSLDPHSPPVLPLASSLEQFLLDWESIGYVGPEIWLLYAFLGRDGFGPLDLEKGKVDLWLNFLLNSRPGEATSVT